MAYLLPGEADNLIADCNAILGDDTKSSAERLQKLLVRVSGDSLDILPVEPRTALVASAVALLDTPTTDTQLIYAARHFPELACAMLERGANGQAVDTTRSYRPGVMQYLLDHSTGLADAYGPSQAQDLLRGAFGHAYPCPNDALLLDVLVEAENNGWVMVLAIDALNLGDQGPQQLLEACVRYKAPAPSLVEAALAKGADLFATFDPKDGSEPCTVIGYAQRHPTSWATEMFNGFAATQQASTLQQAIEPAPSDSARPRF